MLIFLLFLIFTITQSKVIELSLQTFDEVTDHSQYALILYYVPNNNLYESYLPSFEKASEEFETNKHVIFAKFSCEDKLHREICEKEVDEYRYSVKFYYMGSKLTEECTASKDFISNFVFERLIPKDQSHVMVLNNKNFNSVVFDEKLNVVVKFYAPWCGHCRALAPNYISVSMIFAGEKDFVMAEVDCDKYSEICEKYNVMGYPTILIFNKKNEKIEYTYGREVNEFIQAFNNILGYQRTFDGKLGKRCGRIDAIEDRMFGFMGKSVDDQNDVIQFAQLTEGGEYYVKILKYIQKHGKKDIVRNERTRINKNLESKLTPEQRDKYLKKLNILDAF